MTVIATRRRKRSETFWSRFAEAAERSRRAARPYGYVPPLEGGSTRHRVTISHIDAIWPVECVVHGLELDIPRPSFILRTIEDEHVFCGGEVFLQSLREGFDEGVFYLRETVALELSNDLESLESVACSGRRVPVDRYDVLHEARPDFYRMLGVIILDDPEIIRLLPTIPDHRPSPVKEGATEDTEFSEGNSSQ